MMNMKRIAGFLLIVATTVACSKDKFQTVPQVTITSIDPAEVFRGALITLKANVTDKESDQDSVLVVRKIYKTSIVLTDTVKYSISTIGAPKKNQYDIQVQFLYGIIKPDIAPIINTDASIDRGLTLGLIVKDKAGNRSDYVESAKIVLKKG